jgi:hypothetical protein
LSYSKRILRIPRFILKKLAILVSESWNESEALAVEDGEDFIWVWIGTHDEYERMIKEMN